MNNYVKAPFIALGYHRSGTSLLAGLMRCCGIHMGDKLYGPLASNEKGHFEEMNMLHFQRMLLRSICGSDGGIDICPTPDDVARKWQHTSALAAVHKGFPHLSNEPPENIPWGWKDPRTLVFIRKWTEIFPDARYITVIRHPASVAESLRRRDNQSYVRVMDSWYRFHLNLIELISLNRTAIFVYDRLVDDPRLLGNFFKSRLSTGDMLGLDPTESDMEKCTQLVDPNLRHIKSPGNVLTSAASQIWEILKARAIQYI